MRKRVHLCSPKRDILFDTEKARLLIPREQLHSGFKNLHNSFETDLFFWPSTNDFFLRGTGGALRLFDGEEKLLRISEEMAQSIVQGYGENELLEELFLNKQA